jgi:hypothetical protein
MPYVLDNKQYCTERLRACVASFTGNDVDKSHVLWLFKLMCVNHPPTKKDPKHLAHVVADLCVKKMHTDKNPSSGNTNTLNFFNNQIRLAVCRKATLKKSAQNILTPAESAVVNFLDNIDLQLMGKEYYAAINVVFKELRGAKTTLTIPRLTYLLNILEEKTNLAPGTEVNDAKSTVSVNYSNTNVAKQNKQILFGGIIKQLTLSEINLSTYDMNADWKEASKRAQQAKAAWQEDNAKKILKCRETQNTAASVLQNRWRRYIARKRTTAAIVLQKYGRRYIVQKGKDLHREPHSVSEQSSMVSLNRDNADEASSGEVWSTTTIMPTEPDWRELHAAALLEFENASGQPKRQYELALRLFKKADSLKMTLCCQQMVKDAREAIVMQTLKELDMGVTDENGVFITGVEGFSKALAQFLPNNPNTIPTLKHIFDQSDKKMKDRGGWRGEKPSDINIMFKMTTTQMNFATLKQRMDTIAICCDHCSDALVELCAGFPDNSDWLETYATNAFMFLTFAMKMSGVLTTKPLSLGDAFMHGTADVLSTLVSAWSRQ